MAKEKKQVKTTPEKKVKKVTKVDMIKEHLVKHKTITSWEAITKYKATRLAATIANLRNKSSWHIETVMFEDKEGTRYAKYFFKGLPKK
jgi:hypothetical protein